MDTSEKVRENRLRRVARRLGLALRKSRARHIHLDNLGEYMLVDLDLNAVVGGGRYDWDLDDVEAHLTQIETRLRDGRSQ